MALVEIVSGAKEPLRFSDILVLSGQPRGTLHRHLAHLVEEGLLEVRPDQRYVLGLRLLQLAASSWERNDVRIVAEPHLSALQALTGETVHLGLLRDSRIIYLHKVEARQTVRMYSQIGNVSPAYCTGVGKAALSMLDDEPLHALLAVMEFHAFTANTLSTPSALLADIEEIRRRGYALDLEEHEAGICCIAAPVSFARKGVLAAISITGPAYRLTREVLEAWAPGLHVTACALGQDLAARLGPGAKGL